MIAFEVRLLLLPLASLDAISLGTLFAIRVCSMVKVGLRLMNLVLFDQIIGLLYCDKVYRCVVDLYVDCSVVELISRPNRLTHSCIG